MHTLPTRRRRLFAALLCGALLALPAVPAAAQSMPGKWCQGVRIRFFAGGAEGDVFGSIIQHGAAAAAADLGATVDFVFSGWNVERMLAQFRDAIASRPDGIAMMGHAGDNAVMPLAEDARKAGIPVEYLNVDVPKVREANGGGYIGAQLFAQGQRLAEAAVRSLDLKPGDAAVVFGSFGRPGREIRDLGSVKGLEDAGLKVERIAVAPDLFRDPLQLTPQVTAVMTRNPNTKLLVFSGSPLLGTVPQYMDAAGYKAGQVRVIGYDLSPGVLDAMQGGYVQLTSDQQPFLQGYLSVQSLCMTIKLKLAPLTVDTGSGLVTADQAQLVADLVKRGLR